MRRRLVGVLLFLIALASLPVARASDQVVTDSGDNGGPNQLRAKLASVQSSGGGTLTFAPGLDLIVLMAGALPAITANTTIDGGGTITISGANTSSILSVNSGATLTLNNITISNAYNASGDGGAIRNFGTLNINNSKFLQNKTAPDWSGGAILSLGPLNITNSEFGSNQAGNGGALYPRFSPAVTTITGCNFHDNSTTNTTNGWGGAMLLWDGAPVTITNSTFSANIARQGGGIYVFANSSLNVSSSAMNGNMAKNAANSTGGGIFNNGSLTVTQSVFNGNSASSSGGGIYNGNTDSSKMATLTNVTLSGNSAGSGGGYYNDIGKATLTNITFNANMATGYGGGMYNLGVATTLTNATFSGNTAANGGGMVNFGAAPLVNVTFSGNSAAGSGGGIYNSSSSPWTLTNVTLSGNSASNGGGISHYSTNGNTISLKNTIVANSPSGGNCYQGGSFSNLASNGFNLSDDISCGLTSTGDHQGPNFNPQLGQLQSNGGFTQTQLPQSGSPAIDAGTGVGAPARDQRGYVRAGAAPDVGATEFGGTIPVTLANISTRAFVQTGDNVLIGGFIITGGGQKKVMLRAIGPSLNIDGELADPTLELHDSSGATIASNDNWMDAPNKQEIIDSTIPPSNDLESAILMPLDPGAYTAIVRGVNDTTGIGLVEAYDLDRTAGSKLANISTRAVVQTGDNVLIGGFIITGPDSDKVIVRAIGPSLAQLGVANALADPILELHDSNGNVLSNDNWKDTQRAEIEATGIPPTNDLESAIVRTLMPGNYTAIVRGVNDTTGVALVEVYGLN